MTQKTPVLIGIVGWKNSGKTTLVCRLVTELTTRGLTVSTIKHAHHTFDIDHPGTDSHSHRMAGAREVAIVSQNRWAIMHENAPGEPEPAMAETIARLSPCDIILAEGWKAEAHMKIEIQRTDARQTDPLHATDPTIIAVVNPVVPVSRDIPVFGADAITEIADFIVDRTTSHQHASKAVS